MTSALRVRTGVRAGPRRVRPRTDMAAVAELIDLAFRGTLDAPSQLMVRHMRALGKAGWLGWGIARLLLPPAAYGGGFVWEEAGRVIGTASMLPVERAPQRWVVANVAVHPEFRRKGIGRGLVQACLERAWDKRADEVVLQVEPDNRGARNLYLSLGFRTLSNRTTWIRGREAGTAVLPVPSEVVVPRPADREAQWDLARREHPEGLLWPYPLSRSLFDPPRLLGRSGAAQARHWVWQQAGRIIASLSCFPAGHRAGLRLALITSRAARGRVEAGLLAALLADAASHGKELILDYPSDTAAEVLKQTGFRPERELSWMRAVRPGAASRPPAP